MSEVVFRGLNTLLTVLQDLLDRPRALRADRNSERTHWSHSWERALPLVCLIGEQATLWAQALDDRLSRAAPPKVLYAALDVDKAVQDVREADARTAPGDGGPLDSRLVPLLAALQRRLASDRFGRRRVHRFRIAGFTDWLTRQPVRAGHTLHERAAITTVMRTWHRTRPTTGADVTEPVRVTAPGGVAFSPAAVVRRLRYQWWVRFGRERSWLMRQPFLTPGHSESFVGFAEWLTEASHRDDARDELKLLLVHAFLQDLRREYGTATWRFRRGRRTAHVLVLLTGVSEENGGWELLQLINDVRNRSTEPDPLLVVATAEAPPPWLTGEGHTEPVYRLPAVLRQWVQRLPERRQLLHRDARFVVVRMPDEDDGPAGDNDEIAWTEVGHPRPRPVPLPVRKATTRITGVALIGSLLAAGGLWAVPRWIGDCMPGAGIGVRTRLVDGAGGSECIGYSDRAGHVFGDNERLRSAQRAVFEMNEVAQRLHAESATRPLVSVVYFTEFTKPKGQLGADDSTTEQLTGLLLRQAEANRRSDHAVPLLRVIIANAGFEMRHARTLVDMLAPLLAQDPTIMGTVGMGRTVDPVESAIAALGDLGVPVVATTLTGIGLTERSPLYFQVVPNNRQQAALVKRYADQTDKRLTVYQPSRIVGDGYLESLGAEMAELVGPDAFSRWNEIGTLTPECGSDEIAFYAGRQVDFDTFLERVLDVCDDDLPVVIGDDTVARFVAQREKRTKAKYGGKSILYVSLGPETVLRNRTCLPKGDQQVAALCAGLRDLLDGADVYGRAGREFGDILRAQPLAWIGERVGLSHDSAGLFLQAVAATDTAGPGPHRAAVAQELRESACEDPTTTTRNCYEGASGRVDLSKFRDGRNRPLALLRLPDVRDVDRPPECVLLVNADQDLCPHDD
ncbi:type 1 periplasmic-binding domain-containing protein [Saccharothrix stipae]